VTDSAAAPRSRAKQLPSEGLRRYQHAVARQKRTALMRGARKVFLRDGFNRATVAAIAAAAGISPATLYKHFPGGKSEIFGAVVEAGAETVFPALDASEERDQPVESALRGFARAYARMIVNPQTVGFLRIVIAEGRQFPEVVEIWERYGKQRVVRGLRKLLVERDGAGELTLDDEAQAADQLLALLLHPLLWPAFFEPSRPPSEPAIAEIVENALGTFLARYGTGALARRGLPGR
jgi:AcrR family transcriptional regulator